MNKFDKFDKFDKNDGFQKVVRKRYRPNRRDFSDKNKSYDKSNNFEQNRFRKNMPRFVVTRTGAIALYNIQRTPIVLYADQWEKLSGLIEKGILKTFLERNEEIIKRRPKYPMTSEEMNDKWNAMKFDNQHS